MHTVMAWIVHADSTLTELGILFPPKPTPPMKVGVDHTSHRAEKNASLKEFDSKSSPSPSSPTKSSSLVPARSSWGPEALAGLPGPRSPRR